MNTQTSVIFCYNTFSVNVYILFVVNVVFCSSYPCKNVHSKNARESDSFSESTSMFAGLDKSCKMLGMNFFAVNVITFTESSDVFFFFNQAAAISS